MAETIFDREGVNQLSPVLEEGSSIGRLPGRILKRAFDIAASGLGLLLLLPFFVLIGILVKRDSPGPALFWCKRMGRNSRPFRMLKFRTMYEDKRSYQGPPVTFENDSRITPIGKWLRDTKINELPQLWNVFIGEMSLVGPRPEDVDIALEWAPDAREEILSVRPGITSPASILYHDEEHRISSANVMGDYLKNFLPDKIRLDRLYVRNQYFTADLDIIFWTFAIFIPRIAKADIPENLLFFGPISRLIHRYFNWFVIDLIISVLAVSSVSFLLRSQMPVNWGENYSIAFAIGLAILFSSVNSIAGLNRVVWQWATAHDGFNLILSSSAVILSILGINYFQSRFHWFDIPSLPNHLILAVGIAAQIGFVVFRFRLRIITSIASRWLKYRRYSIGIGEKVLIVGMGENFKTALWLLRREESRCMFSIVGVVDNNTQRQHGMWVNECLVLGGITDIPKLVDKHDIGVIILTDSNIPAETRGMLNHLRETHNVRIAFIDQIVNILSEQITQPTSLPPQVLWTQNQYKYFAIYDVVTGLPNKFLFCEQLRHSLAYAKRYQTITLVVFIQLEDHKTYAANGKKTWVGILEKVAKRLLEHKRDSDTLSYMDHGEFGLILENVSDQSDLNLIVQRIEEIISKPITVNDQQIQLTPKISFWKNNLDDHTESDRLSNEAIELLLEQGKTSVNWERSWNELG